VTETPNPHIVDAETMTGEMRPIRRAVLSVGSNLGERLASLQGAVDSLADTPEVSIVGVSPVYETDPVDAPEGSRDFLNAVIVVETTLRAQTLLDRAKAIEEAFGRERRSDNERNAPRTLDVDIIVYGDRSYDTDDLVIPHPRAPERGFVLRPWLDVDPAAEIPGRGLVADLIESVDLAGVRPRADLELAQQ
jgi:2-amino-4-hydroxy-6-hydroxymethyldihydropteridine diphosphokinase